MHFGLLGPVLVHDDDHRQLLISAPRQRVLLAALLLRANTVVSTAALAELVWDGQPPRGAVAALQNHVMRLRHSLGPLVGARLRTQELGYLLEVADEEFDVAVFTTRCGIGRAASRAGDWAAAADHLSGALRLWRGDPLVDVPSELLHRDHGARLAESRVQAVEWRADADLALGRHEELVPELRQLAREHPLREHIHVQLVTALIECGRRAEAMSAYRTARLELVENLGIEPGARLRALHDRILRGEPDQPDEPVVAPSGPAAGPGTIDHPPEGTRPTADRQALTDRQAELAELALLGDDVRAGRSRLACVAGPVGIGKSALIDEWVHRERSRGTRVLRAICAPEERNFALAAVRQLFERVLAAAGDDERSRLLHGPGELAAQALAQGPEPEPDEARQPSAQALLHALYWFLVNLSAAGPLVLVLDDVESCDVPSLRWLSYLSRRLDGLPVALVLTVSTGGDDAADPLADIMARPDCDVLELGPLTRRGVAGLVRRVLGADTTEAVCGACHDVSAGNPMFLDELLRHLRRGGAKIDDPDQVWAFGARRLVRDSIAELARQDTRTVRVATALAVLGEAATAPLAAQVCDLGELEVVEQVRRLRHLDVIGEQRPWTFRYPMVRDGLLTGLLTPDELAAAHSRAARALHHNGAPSEMVAAHLLLGNEFESDWPVAALQDAARVARGRGAPDIAAGYLKRALRVRLDDATRRRMVIALGIDEFQYNPAASARHLREGLALTRDTSERARVAGLLAAALHVAKCGDDAVDVLEDALCELPDTTDGGPVRELRMALKAQLIQVGYETTTTYPVVEKHLAELDVDGLAGETAGERALLAALAVHSLAGNGGAEHAVELVGRALRSGLQVNAPTGALFPLAIFVLSCGDRLAEAAGWFDEMAEQGRRDGPAWLSLLARYGSATVAARRGDLPEALMRASAVLELTPADLGYSALPFVGLIVNALIDQGELDRAGQVLSDYQGNDVAGALWDRGGFLLARGRLRLALGDSASALAAFLECGNHLDSAGLVNPSVVAWQSQAALAYAALGQRNAAIEMATAELARSRRWGTARCVGVSLRCLGVVTGGEPGLALLGQAVAELDRSPARLELARALTDEGRAWLHHGDTERAVRSLGRALDLAQRCGARALVADTLHALRQAGAAPQEPRQETTAGLTASEHQIVSMAATGLSDQDIAEALFVTRGTVEQHLGSACRKLGVDGREGLVNAVHGVGLAL
ncbi:BTAD domain-containing putative transcriptional regulator [Lentzea terrae]|uniref:BTAD domain-containing putative transcriptional regulator n=1 Tax=Lentzea terrae TaxID=2200761 RepID=UPI0018E592E1|nr:BTAD domain-containing putative transcriptional regulator [Lentzea terrae]